MHPHDPFAPRARWPQPRRCARSTARTRWAVVRARRAVSIQGQHVEGLGGEGVNGEWGDLAANPVVAAAGPSTPSNADPSRHPDRFESAHWITRSRCAWRCATPIAPAAPRSSPRGRAGGVLYVFMPPLTSLDDYLDLLAAIEATAAETGLKVVLEGYPPPRDARLKVLQVTPDPGVIEVNIHPASSWAQLVDHTEFLYQAAHETRLSTEKFMVDGRHTGTGGGNHFVLGGATQRTAPSCAAPTSSPAC